MAIGKPINIAGERVKEPCLQHKPPRQTHCIMDKYTMRPLLFALTVLFALAVQPVRAASQEEEARFVAAAKQAFQKRDADALMALTCWDRVPDKFRYSGRKQYARDVAQTVSGITLNAPDPKYPDLEWKDKDGVSYRSNLSVVKQMKITFAPGGRFKDGRYPVGEKDGKLYLLQPAPVRIPPL